MSEQISIEPRRTAIDWLDGSTEIELSARHLRAYWDADIIDVDDKNKYDKIIERKDPFEVRFRVYLKGRLWKLYLRPLVLRRRLHRDREGCGLQPLRRPVRPVGTPDQGLERLRRAVHRAVTVYVPGGTIPAEHCGTLYEVAA